MSRDGVVGFVGLGNLGQAMALRLADKDWRLRVVDPKSERLGPLLAQGGSVTDASGLAEAPTICFAVPDDRAIRAVLDSGLGERLGPDHTVVVHSTILPDSARRLAQRVEESGASFLEAPVSGGAERARRGELTMFLGGSASALERARPVLDDLATQLFVLGAVGAASATKLANQLVMFSALAGVHEALRLVRPHGVSETAALEAIASGTGDTWVGRNWGFFDRVAADYTEAGVPVENRPWSKDVWEILSAARQAGQDLPVAGLLSQTITQTVEAHATEVQAARSEKGKTA